MDKNHPKVEYGNTGVLIVQFRDTRHLGGGILENI